MQPILPINVWLSEAFCSVGWLIKLLSKTHTIRLSLSTYLGFLDYILMPHDMITAFLVRLNFFF